MSTYIKFVLIAIIVLVTRTVFSFEPPKPTSYVVDVAGKLTPDQLTFLNEKLNVLNKTTKNEFAGLIIPTLSGESIEDVANATFKSWKIGKAGLDNGVLVVIAIAERKSRIETGKGVEGDLTDLQSNDILRTVLAPRLKQGDFYGGLLNTFDAISSKIESRSKATVSDPRHSNNVNCDVSNVGSQISQHTSLLITIIVFCVFSVLYVIMKYKKSRKQQKSIYFVQDPLDKYKEINKQVISKTIKNFEKVDHEKEIFLADAKLYAEKVKQFNEVSERLETERKAKECLLKSNKHSNTKHVVKRDGVIIEPTAIGETEKHRQNKLQELINKKDRADYELQRRNRELKAKLQEKYDNDRRMLDEEDRRRREEEDRRRSQSSSYSSSSSIFDWGNSSSSSNDSSFGGFGGGDSSGGGSSSDW